MQKAFRISSFNYRAKSGEQISSWAHVHLRHPGSCKPAIKSAYLFTAGLGHPPRQSVKASATVCSWKLIAWCSQKCPNMVSHPLTWHLSKCCPCKARQPCHDETKV